MLFYHVKHVLVKSSVPPVADNQDDDHSNISEEENESDSNSEDEESDGSSDQESERVVKKNPLVAAVVNMM